MSAYLVSENTIHAVVNGLFQHEMASWMFSGTPFERFYRTDDRQGFGQTLWTMNADAVNGRYGESEPAPTYVHGFVNVQSQIALSKNLSCLLYQCSEEPVVETDAYKALDRISQQLCSAIVSDLPEWQAATWGLE